MNDAIDSPARRRGGSAGGAGSPTVAEIGDAPWTGAASPSWAVGIDVADFLALREGCVPLVIVAPHGGRRRRAIRRGDSVNDLHTASIAWELAERLGAHAIVNHGLDRNDIDLNRISHLTTRAPAVLALLAAAIDAAAVDGAVPFVLFVHGWNMVVPCCDIGIGLRRRGGVLTGRYPTLHPARYDGAIAAIERELGVRGLSSAIGRRYTASGRDNAAQLFSGRHARDSDRTVSALARLAIEGGVDAAQLELGIPLRWPGPARDALVEALVAALGQSAVPAVVAQAPRSRPEVSRRGDEQNREGTWFLPATPVDSAPVSVERGFSLQAVLDDEGRIALFCGVEATGPHSMAARFCIVDTDGSMLLLVGEGEWGGEQGRYAIEGLEWSHRESDARVDLTIRAPLIRYRTHDAYLDLESGLSGCELVDGNVELRFDAISADHGRLSGVLHVGDLDLVIDTIAFVDRGNRRGAASQARVRVLAARPQGDVVVVRSDALGTASLEIADDEGLGVILATGHAGGLLDAQIVARVPVWRPLGEGVFSRWTFGIVHCRFGDADETSAGLFESIEVFPRAAAAST